ncbi:hypothetical protein J8273_0300 [Carpediemonas membranifera]|uniref:Uncharacterized protein n=1 Tax=Carpediemonas membranifera TaxID=201153 RepID=A0A8J6B821_9EUKA|nr:hypothetical protein J8273_0300 [Carpediemonas membranifera]|eukprot:KAG9395084.1 hypothetical protein J8273_0300 [Carpediemonas membranifera]
MAKYDNVQFISIGNARGDVIVFPKCVGYTIDRKFVKIPYNKKSVLLNLGTSVIISPNDPAFCGDVEIAFQSPDVALGFEQELTSLIDDSSNLDEIYRDFVAAVSASGSSDAVLEIRNGQAWLTDLNTNMVKRFSTDECELVDDSWSVADQRVRFASSEHAEQAYMQMIAAM